MGRRRKPARSEPVETERPVPPDPFVRCPAFIGYRVPTSVSNALLDVQRRMDRQSHDTARLRWVSALELHVNLRFLGPVLPETLEHATAVLQALAEDQTSFPVRAAELTLWPEEGPPAALWATLDGEDERLGALREALDDQLGESGFALPEHPFVPHITLALIDELPDAEDFLQHARAARGQGLGRFWLSELQLFLQPEGEPTACYEQVARAALRRPPQRDARPDEDSQVPAEPPAPPEPPQHTEPTEEASQPDPEKTTPDAEPRREQEAE